jgi:hypothetical protein
MDPAKYIVVVQIYQLASMRRETWKGSALVVKKSKRDNSTHANENEQTADDQRCPKQQAFEPVQFKSRNRHKGFTPFSG